MARGIDRTELLELLAETVNNENPMLHLMSVNVCWSWISSFCELFWTLPKFNTGIMMKEDRPGRYGIFLWWAECKRRQK